MKTKLIKKTIREFLEALVLKYNISIVECEFSGSGDSGEIENPTANTVIDGITTPIVFEEDELGTLSNLLETYLNGTDYDWYNNDGGQGTISLDLKTGKITLDIDINEMSSTNYGEEDEEFVNKFEI